MWRLDAARGRGVSAFSLALFSLEDALGLWRPWALGEADSWFTCGFSARVQVRRYGTRSAIMTLLARAVWETEVHLCAGPWAWIWPLHTLWHAGICFAANDLFSCIYYYRISMLGADGVVHVGKGLRGAEADGKLAHLLLAPEWTKPTLAEMSRRAPLRSGLSTPGRAGTPTRSSARLAKPKAE
jgi:hypothetical protein